MPQTTPLISLIVLNRNGAVLLDRLLTSISAHNTWPSLEILVVDHASTDGSLDVCAKWRDRLAVKVFACDGNYSFSWSNNRAIERARGDVVVLLNNDVIFESDLLPPLVDSVRATGGIVGIRLIDQAPDGTRRLHHAGIRFAWNPVRRILMPHNINIPHSTDEAAASRPMISVTGALLALPRATYMALGGLAEDYVYGYEDVDLCLKAHAAGLPIVCRDDLVATHQESATRRKAPTKAARQRHRANMQVLDRRFGPLLWRWWRHSILSGSGLLSHRPTSAVVLGHSPWATAMATELADSGWDIRHRRRKPWRPALLDRPEPDVLLIAKPDASLRAARTGLRLATVGLVEDAVAWCRRGDLAAFDLLVCQTADAARHMHAVGARRVLQATTAADIQAELAARAALPDRIAISGPKGCDRDPAVKALARDLCASGYVVRIDTPRGRANALAMTDDVTLLLPGGRSMPPLPDARQTLPVAAGTTAAQIIARLTAGQSRRPQDAALTNAPPDSPIPAMSDQW